jgi:hypothetical protein
LRDPTTVTEEHEAETHDHGDAVETGCGVEVVPGGEEGVAVEVKEGAEENGRDDVEQLLGWMDRVVDMYMVRLASSYC